MDLYCATATKRTRIDFGTHKTSSVLEVGQLSDLLPIVSKWHSSDGDVTYHSIRTERASSEEIQMYIEKLQAKMKTTNQNIQKAKSLIKIAEQSLIEDSNIIAQLESQIQQKNRR